MIFDEIKEYVKQRDVDMVRKELLAIFNSNPDMRDGNFVENLHYIEDKLGEDTLYQKYSGVFEIQKNELQWTTNYIATVFLYLRKEFSKELVYHLIEAAPATYTDLADKKEQATVNLSDSKKKDAYMALTSRTGYVAIIILMILLILLIMKILK